MNYNELTKKICDNDYETKLPYPMYSDKKRPKDDTIKDKEIKNAHREDARRLIKEFEKDIKK